MFCVALVVLLSSHSSAGGCNVELNNVAFGPMPLAVTPMQLTRQTLELKVGPDLQNLGQVANFLPTLARVRASYTLQNPLARAAAVWVAFPIEEYSCEVPSLETAVVLEAVRLGGQTLKWSRHAMRPDGTGREVRGQDARFRVRLPAHSKRVLELSYTLHRAEGINLVLSGKHSEKGLNRFLPAVGPSWSGPGVHSEVRLGFRFLVSSEVLRTPQWPYRFSNGEFRWFWPHLTPKDTVLLDLRLHDLLAWSNFRAARARYQQDAQDWSFALDYAVARFEFDEGVYTREVKATLEKALRLAHQEAELGGSYTPAPTDEVVYGTCIVSALCGFPVARVRLERLKMQWLAPRWSGSFLYDYGQGERRLSPLSGDSAEAHQKRKLLRALLEDILREDPGLLEAKILLESNQN